MGLFFLVILAFVCIAGLSWKQMQDVSAAWGEIAREFGLSLDEGGLMASPQMSGSFATCQITVDVHTSSAGKDRTKMTRYMVVHLPVGPPVTMTKQRAFSFLRRIVGGTDHEIGDPFFDDEIIVDSQYPDEIREFLTPARRAAVLHLFARYGSAEITDKSIVVSTRTVETNPDAMRSTLRLLIDVAAVLGDASAVDELLAHQQAGDLRDAAQGLRDLNQQSPNAFTKQLEAEAWTEIGDHESAAPVFDELRDLLPENSEVKNWSRVAHTPAPPPPPPPPAPSPPDLPAPPGPGAAPPSTSGADQQAVIDDLFDPARMSWEIVEHFEATYQNQPVSWTGEVTTFGRYRHDSDFGEGPGIKATVLLGTVGRSAFISSEVHAILELPALVELERGTHISFSGVLTTVDRFSRKLQVRSASLHGG